MMKKLFIVLLVLTLCGCSAKKDEEIAALKVQVEEQAQQIADLTATLEAERKASENDIKVPEKIMHPDVKELTELFAGACKDYYDGKLTDTDFMDKMDVVSSRAGSLSKSLKEESHDDYVVAVGISYYSSLFKSSVNVKGYNGFLKEYEKYIKK